MANQSNLKAWVRYDGTGTVVTAGPIFQANKPKVGNWRQINSSLCCNPSSTTTTTTTQGGGVTPTAWMAYVASNPYSACQQSNGTSIILYTSTSTLATGVTFYQDAALTIPYDSTLYGVSVNINGTLYALVDNAPPVIAAVLSCDGFTTTTTTTTAGSVTVSANFSTAQCAGNFMISPITYPPGVTNFCDATTITSDGLYMSPNPVWITVDGFTADYSISGNVGTRLSPCTSCG